MNQDLSSEDRTILAALDSLEGGSGEPVVASGEPSEADETLARLYTEVVGLVTYELEPAAPRPEVKARLLAMVRGETSSEMSPELSPTPRPAPAPIPPPAPSRSSRDSRDSREIPVAGRGAMSRRRRSVWPLALAATLVLALGGLSAWLLMERTKQVSTIAVLEKELAEVRQQAEQSEAQVRQMRGSMERMGENLAMVTSPAVTVSPLRPAGEQSAARGVLFVAADHQHWYLTVHDLSPAESGRDYQLWWVTDQGMVSGGTFEARQGEKVELSSETMPENTRNVMITVEPEGGVRTPTGPEVLRGAGVYQIL